VTSYQYMPYGALEQYMRAVNWVPQLVESEEEQLLTCLKFGEGTQATRTRLVEGYQPLIIGLARRYVRHCRDLELMDLVQEGNLGLLQAIDRYEFRDSGASFKTWAFTWVRGAMLVALCQEGAFHVPVAKIKAVRRMEHVSAHLLALLGREPTIAEIAQEMGMEDCEVRELVVLQGRETYSLYLPVSEDGETLLEDVIEDPVASAFVEDGLSSVEDVLTHLTESERMVVGLRYGLVDGLPYTQRETAELLGIALSTVMALDRSAKRRLRKALALAVA
jgi:RNA polymerase primary sigma factor